MTNKEGVKEQVIKSIEAPCVAGADRHTPIREVSVLMDSLVKNTMDHTPWPAYEYKPQVHFVVAHSNNCVFIKYYIKEKVVKADYQRTNEPVYKDSCVEFFISFGAGEGYYNFEFNCVGACLCGYGPGKQGRQLLSQELIERIRRQTLVKRESDLVEPFVYWELTIVIPVEVFCFHQLTTLKGQQCGVNFYKCGDDLPQPHYLTWANIESEEPNFHLSEFFGKMTFA